MRELLSSLAREATAVLPLAVIVILLQATPFALSTTDFLRLLYGLVMVIIGLFLFMHGVKIGLLPIGELIGSQLPARGSMLLLLLAAFALGFAVTVAEPDVRVLAYQVDTVSEGMLSLPVLVATVSVGVGVFFLLAVLRVFLGIPTIYLLIGGYAIAILLSPFAPPQYVPIAFDAGGVTTGPVTVPFLLSFGLGTASVLGGRSSLASGFGLVGLASIGPVIAVMLLGVLFG